MQWYWKPKRPDRAIPPGGSIERDIRTKVTSGTVTMDRKGSPVTMPLKRPLGRSTR